MWPGSALVRLHAHNIQAYGVSVSILAGGAAPVGLQRVAGVEGLLRRNLVRTRPSCRRVGRELGRRREQSAEQSSKRLGACLRAVVRDRPPAARAVCWVWRSFLIVLR